MPPGTDPETVPFAKEVTLRIVTVAAARVGPGPAVADSIPIQLEMRMAKKPQASVVRPLKLYATAHAALLLGAWAMHVSGSMLPMALAASASLMLTVPLVRHFLDRARSGR